MTTKLIKLACNHLIPRGGSPHLVEAYLIHKSLVLQHASTILWCAQRVSRTLQNLGACPPTAWLSSRNYQKWGQRWVWCDIS